MSDICTDIDSCLDGGLTTRRTQQKDIDNIEHTLNINNYLLIGKVQIPIRKRVRSFSLKHTRGSKLNDYRVVIDLQFYEHDCYETESLWSLSVSEDSTFTDGTVYILNSEHNNAFWREDTYSCKFVGYSNDTTSFITPPGVASKLRINDVHYDITTTWKLMINGNIEILFTETSTQRLYSNENPLFFVHPPPFLGESIDPDFLSVEEGGRGFGFLDYRTGGQGPSEAEIKSGGIDYFYPEYLWYMGRYREADQYDAVERFWDGYGSITNLKESEYRHAARPAIHGAEDPRGSIVRDFNGNTLASVTVTKGDGTLLNFNKLYSVSGEIITIPEMVSGESIRLYPAGLI